MAKTGGKVCMRVCVCLFLYACVYACMCVRACICARVCMRVRVYVCVYACVWCRLCVCARSGCSVRGGCVCHSGKKGGGTVAASVTVVGSGPDGNQQPVEEVFKAVHRKLM